MTGADQKTLGELCATVAHMTKQSDRLDLDFREFRDEVKEDLTAMRKTLSDNGEKLTIIRAVWLVLKVILGAAVTIAGLALGYKGFK